MFDFLSSLWGNPMAQGLLGGTQAAGPAASFGGLGGPQYGGFESFGQANPFMAGAMPNLMDPRQAVATPADLVPQTTTPQVPQFPWATPPIMPDITGERERAFQDALNQGMRGAGMVFSGGEDEPRMSPPSGAGLSMGRPSAYQWMPMAALGRRR